MTIPDFTGYTPYHCAICGANWDKAHKPHCPHAPGFWGPMPTEEEADRLCAEDERRAEGR